MTQTKLQQHYIRLETGEVKCFYLASEVDQVLEDLNNTIQDMGWQIQESNERND